MDRVGPDEFSGFELADYEESIRSAVKDSFRGTGEDLMPYFSEKRNPGVKAKVLSAIPSIQPIYIVVDLLGEEIPFQWGV